MLPSKDEIKREARLLVLEHLLVTLFQALAQNGVKFDHEKMLRDLRENPEGLEGVDPGHVALVTGELEDAMRDLLSRIGGSAGPR